MVFIEEMEAFGDRLREAGFTVDIPVREEVQIDWQALPDHESSEKKRSYIDGHLETIRRSDLVLLANYPKNGIDGYIGANTLMEAAFAYALGIPVAYFRTPGEQSCRLEALAICRSVVGEDMSAVSAILQD